MAGVELQITPCKKDLGVYIDNKLKFHDHVVHAVNKGNRMLGLIKNTFSCLDKETTPKLHKASPRIWQRDLAPKVRDGQNSSGKGSEEDNKAGSGTKTSTL